MANTFKEMRCDDASNRTETLRLSWERDLGTYLNASSDTDAEHQRVRGSLVQAVQADPQSAGAWWAFLRHEEAFGGASAASTPRGSVPSLCDLYRWATRLVPRQDSHCKAAFVNLWLGYARQQWFRNSHDDARDTFKTLKSQQIGEEYAIMYAEWGGLEAAAGNTAKALSIVSKGIKTGAAPQGILVDMQRALGDGRYAYVPFYRIPGVVKDPAGTPRYTPSSSARPSSTTPAVDRAPREAALLPLPHFSSTTTSDFKSAASRPATTTISHSSFSHASSHSAKSSGSHSQHHTQHAQHQTPVCVASAASMRTGSSAGTSGSEEATVSMQRSAQQPTRTITSGSGAAAAAAEVAGGTAAAAAPHGATPAGPSSAAAAAAVAANRRPGMKSPWSGPADAADGAAPPRRLQRFGVMGKALRVTAAADAPAAAAPEEAATAGLRTPMAAAESAPGFADPFSHAAGPSVSKFQLQPVPEDGSPSTAKTAPRPAAPAPPAPCGGQLVLEDGPVAAAEEATARVSSSGRAFGAGGGALGGGLGRELVGIPEDPGATVPLSRPVVAAAAEARAAPPQLLPPRAHEPAAAAAPAPAQPHLPPPPPRAPSHARPAAPAAAAAAAVPPAPAASSGRRIIEDEDSVTVRGITYTKLECVGRGGSSKVYKVMAPNKKIFALKRIRLNGCDAEAAAGFLDEITLLTKLRGKSNIIQLVDSEVHRAQSLIYMVLEYGDIDLARLLQKHDAGRKERAAAVAGAGGAPVAYDAADENFIRLYWQQMLQAVDTIHRERIVHSDLKPANFLVVEGQLKLIDFGIAKAIQSDTTSIARESQVGTLNYMSPEAILGGNSGGRGGPPTKVGRASDIWSLGCILYQMAYGRTPFAHLPFIQKMHAITNERYNIEFPPLRNTALLDVIRRCLDRNARARIAMQELLDHPFLAPTNAAAGQHRGDGGGGDRIELDEQQLRKLLMKVCQTGGVSDAEVGQLSGQLFKQLASGALSPDVLAAKLGRRRPAALAGDENLQPAMPPPAARTPF